MSEQPRAVTVHLSGGLGNQLFQYAFGRRLSLANGACLYLDASDYRSGTLPNYETGVRVCELSDFAIAGRIIEDRAAPGEKRRLTPRRWMGRKLVKWRRKAILFADRTQPYYMRQEIVEPEENRFRFDARVYGRTFEGAVSVRGFWQTEKYFADIDGLLREELVVRHEMTGKNLETAKEMERGDSVCVHVRHGDNANPIAERLGVLPRAYYVQAVGELQRELASPHFFVFSDDMSWAKQVLPLGLHITYVEHNRGAQKP